MNNDYNNMSNIPISNLPGKPIEIEKQTQKKESVLISLVKMISSPSETPQRPLRFDRKVKVLSKGSTANIDAGVLNTNVFPPEFKKKFFAVIKSINENVSLDPTDKTIKIISKDIKKLEEDYAMLSKAPELLESDEDRTTFFVLTEALAKHYFISDQPAKGFNVRFQTANLVKLGHPLTELEKCIKDNLLPFSAKVSSVDTHLIKNQSLSVAYRKVESMADPHEIKEIVHIECELHHHARKTIGEFINQLNENPSCLDSLGIKTTISVVDNTYKGKNAENVFLQDPKKGFSCGKMTEINMEGIGTIKVGANEQYLGIYRQLVIDLDPSMSLSEAPRELQKIFLLLGLAPVASKSREQDVEKIKVLQMFKAFHPNNALSFERNLKTYHTSVEDLKKMIIKDCPDMKIHFKSLSKMYLQEVYPGESIWAIDGYAEKVRSEGGVALMSGIPISLHNFNKGCMNVASLLKYGALSSTERFKNSMIIPGASSEQDIKLGGGDSVFTRLINEQMMDEAKNKKKVRMPYAGKIQVFYDLKLLERVGYCYNSDEYGTKESVDLGSPSKKEGYNHRPAVHELAANKDIQYSNEVCIKPTLSNSIRGYIFDRLEQIQDRVHRFSLQCSQNS